jgi:hypothetical protein
MGIVLLVLAGCSDDSEPEVTEDEYLEQLQDICRETTAALDALPQPPEQISIADFAGEAARTLTGEAERMRLLEPPAELDDDQRALVANTDDQAAAWTALGETPGDDAAALEAASTRIAELTLGRNDLAVEIGATDCGRAPQGAPPVARRRTVGGRRDTPMLPGLRWSGH